MTNQRDLPIYRSTAMVLLVTAGLGAGCSETVTETTARIREKFGKQVTHYEESRKKVSEEVTDRFKSFTVNTQRLISEAGDKITPELTAEISKFEKDWSVVNAEMEELKGKFETVKARGEELFKAQDDSLKTFSDERMRSEESLRIRKARIEWDSAVANGTRYFEEMQVVWRKAKDIHTVIVNSLMRKVILQKIDEMKALADQTLQVIKKLEEVSQAGSLLIGKMGS